MKKDKIKIFLIKMFGLGVEYETFLFYNFKNKIYAVDFLNLLKLKKKLSDEEITFINNLPMPEKVENFCITKIKAKQLEMVTRMPINKTIEEAIEELKISKRKLLFIFQKLFNIYYNNQNIILYYPEISCMKYIDLDGTETFSNVGTIHINISYPAEKTKQLNKYKRFINIFQTIEPILTGVTSSGDFRYKKGKQYVVSGYRQTNGWSTSGEPILIY